MNKSKKENLIPEDQVRALLDAVNDNSREIYSNEIKGENILSQETVDGILSGVLSSDKSLSSEEQEKAWKEFTQAIKKQKR